MNENVFKYKKISCQSESDLSEGSRMILRHQKHELFAFFRGKLTNHKLRHRYSEYEIFNEAYGRTVKTLRKGRIITNLYGWYKSTGYNIIREYSRKEIKQRDIKIRLQSHLKATYKSIEKAESSEDSEIIKTIKNSVKSETDFKIICLRVLDELSWVEVCETLVRDGDLNCELSKRFVERIKQRFHRALKKIPNLRKIKLGESI